MAKKEKKVKKEKGPSFFSSLNTDKSIEYGYAEKNPKSKWAKWIIAGLVLGVTATGISVPWALSSCTLSLTEPYSDSRVMYWYIDPITNKKVEVTYKEFEDRINSIQVTPSIFEKWDEVFYTSVLEELYNQEREGFLRFKAIYKKIHDKDPSNDIFGATIDSSFEEVRSSQRKILEENKKNFQKATDNDKGWLDKWIMELQTNSIYGPQIAEKNSKNVKALENKAIDYMVSQKIKDSALARFKGASITTDSWDYQDLNFVNKTNAATTGIFVKYKDNAGKEQTLTEQQAIDIWKSYLVVPTYDVQGEVNNWNDSPNVVTPKQPSNSDNNKKIAVFETKSYSTEYRNPLKQDLLFSMLKKSFKVDLISSVSITSIKPGTKNSDPFEITSDVIEKLFKVENPPGAQQVVNFVTLSQLSKFKGAGIINTSRADSSSANVQNQKDQVLLNVLGSTDHKIFGSSKLQELSSLFTAQTSDSGDSGEGDKRNISVQNREGESSSSTLNTFNLLALTASNEGALNTNAGDSLLSINQTNPFNEFMSLVFSIGTNNGVLNLDSKPIIKKNWNDLSYGVTNVSNNLLSFIQFLQQNINESTFEFKGSNPFNFNNELSTRVKSNLTADDFKFLGKILNCVLIGDTTKANTIYGNNIDPLGKVGYWTFYQLTAPEANNNFTGTYLYVDPSGIKIFSRRNASSLTIDDYKKMALNDLYKTIDALGDAISLVYDVPTILNKVNNEHLIISTLLKDGANKQKFIDAIKKNISADKEAFGIDSNLSESEQNNLIDAKATQISNQFINSSNLQFKFKIEEAKSTIISKVSDSLKTIIESKRTYDFGTITLANGENVVALQTQTKYNTNSVAQGQEEINKLFIQNILNILTINETTKSKKGGK